MMTTMQGGWISRAGRALVPAGSVVVVAAPVAAHVALVSGRWAVVALALTALQGVWMLFLAWRAQPGWRRRVWGGLAMVLFGLVALRAAWPRAAGDAGLLATSGLSHTAIYTSLLLLFGQTLWPGRTALITGLAQRLRGTLSPAMIGYTRTVTKAWCCFFGAQLLISAMLLFCTSRAAWSLFVNVLDLPLLAAMALGEYAVRRLRFRNTPHSSPMEAFRRFSADG
jgi:uncharacterized membrane protein